MKILSGAHPAVSGQITLQGKNYEPSGDPNLARQSGVAMIYLELNLAPDLAVEDNLMLGQPCAPGDLLWRRPQWHIVQSALERVGLQDLAPTAIVGKLSVATQQLIEIARALTSNAKIILFYEPTSSLPRDDLHGFGGRGHPAVHDLRSQSL